MTHWAAAYLSQVEDCEEHDDQLTAWEHDFIKSIRDRLESSIKPSPKQIDTLDSIWEKVTRRG